MLMCVGSRAALGSSLPGHILPWLSTMPRWTRSPGYDRVWESNPLRPSQQLVCAAPGDAGAGMQRLSSNSPGRTQAPSVFGLGFACVGRFLAEDERGRAVQGGELFLGRFSGHPHHLSVLGRSVAWLSITPLLSLSLSGLQILVESPGGGTCWEMSSPLRLPWGW